MGGQKNHARPLFSEEVPYLLVSDEFELDIGAACGHVIPVDEAFPLAHKQPVHIKQLPERAVFREALPAIGPARGDCRTIKDQIMQTDEVEQPIASPEAEDMHRCLEKPE